MFFSKKRRDGTYIAPTETYSIVLPHLFKSRTESLVYYPMVIDVEPARAFIRDQRAQGVELSLFHIVCAACIRVMHDFPSINRFIAGRRMYLHNDYKLAYTIKHSMQLDSAESTVCEAFEPEDTVFDVARRMEEDIAQKRAEAGVSDEEKLIKVVQRLPRPLLRALVGLVMWTDYHDVMPNFLREILPFYCTVFIANMGSVGMNAPYHHLYEMGTCSVFMTMGRINRENVLKPDGTVGQRVTMQFTWTVDERIVDGYYLSRTLRQFEHLMKHPDLLALPPKKKD